MHERTQYFLQADTYAGKRGFTTFSHIFKNHFHKFAGLKFEFFLSTGITVDAFAAKGKVFVTKLLFIASERGLPQMFEDNLISLEGILWVTGAFLDSKAFKYD